ncbi:MAG TPA: hypothetical protein EYP29_01975 [Thermoplasmata archaeon]|nr:hypothetical protein [Thermoplasmata archaeon]
MKNKRCPSSLTIFTGILLLASLTGCIEFDTDKEEKTPGTVYKPIWYPGLYWVYTFTTPEFQQIVSKMVVAADDGINHLVGISTLLDAQRHAVLNFNPVLGRVRMEDMAVYEKGVPQVILSFPLKERKIWNFSLLDVENFTAEVKKIWAADLASGERTVLVEVEALAASGERMHYVYDSEAMWLRSLNFTSSDGETKLEMKLVSYGDGFSGTVYFVRGRDLYNGDYTSTVGEPVVEIYDSFVDTGHPRYGAFDNLIYFLEVKTDQDGSGSLYLRDHTGESALTRSFGPNTEESSLGTIPSSSGNWTVEINLQGNAHLRLRVAGGIVYSWDV